MKFSVWPNMGHPVDEALDTARLGRRRRLVRRLVRRPLHAEHRHRGDPSRAIRTSAGRCCRRSPPSPNTFASARSWRRRRSTTPPCSPTERRRSTTCPTAAWCSASAPDGRSTSTSHTASSSSRRAAGCSASRRRSRSSAALTTQDRTTFDGEVYTITDATADPKPIQSPLPLLVGTAGPRMLRIVARYADEWNTWGHVETATSKRAAFVEACESEGRDPDVDAHVGAGADRHHRGRGGDRTHAGTGAFADRTLAGSVDQIVDAMGRYAELGFDEFIVPDANLGRDRVPASRAARADRRRDRQPVPRFVIVTRGTCRRPPGRLRPAGSSTPAAPPVTPASRR